MMLPMEKQEHPVERVYRVLGGRPAVGQIFQVGASSLSNWKRDGFPERIHYRIVRELRERGYDIDPASPETLRRLANPEAA